MKRDECIVFDLKYMVRGFGSELHLACADADNGDILNLSTIAGLSDGAGDLALCIRHGACRIQYMRSTMDEMPSLLGYEILTPIEVASVEPVSDDEFREVAMGIRSSNAVYGNFYIVGMHGYSDISLKLEKIQDDRSGVGGVDGYGALLYRARGAKQLYYSSVNINKLYDLATKLYMVHAGNIYRVMPPIPMLAVFSHSILPGYGLQIQFAWIDMARLRHSFTQFLEEGSVSNKIKEHIREILDKLVPGSGQGGAQTKTTKDSEGVTI